MRPKLAADEESVVRTHLQTLGVLLGELLAFFALLTFGFGGPLWIIGIGFLFLYAAVVWLSAQLFVILRTIWGQESQSNSST